MGVPTKGIVSVKYETVLGPIKILLVRVKNPRSSYTGFPKQAVRKKRKKKSLLQHTLPHILYCAISVFVLFSLLLAQSLFAKIH